jgi:hypothetical protein
VDAVRGLRRVRPRSILDDAARNGLPIVDDREAVPPDAAHFSDGMHFSDKGAEAMADRFFRYLRTSDELQRAIARAQAAHVGTTR